jgi:hypothetical protein
MNNLLFKKKQVFILPFIVLSLLFGIWTGWIRIGWSLPINSAQTDHGALMVGGFIGTLICLERTVNFKNKIALLVPFISSMSIIFFVIKLPHVSYWLLFAGSAGLIIIYLILYIERNDLHILIMMVGALCYLIGNAILLKTSFYPQAVMWWIAFVYFTILGERLELSKYLNIKTNQKILLLVLLMVYVVAIILPFHGNGGYIAAISLIGSALWLFKYDMAKKSLQKAGQHFFSGLVLLTGYEWLIICGLFMAYGAYSGLLYDAAVHSFFLGFVFSMIFAHAPIVLPGVLRLEVNPFHKILYLWFAILQVSLILRLISAFTLSTAVKHTGALFNGIAILGFFVTMAVLVRMSKKSKLPG